MDGHVVVVARDPRVSAILTNPDLYFNDACHRAWDNARADIARELARRARDRRDHAARRPTVVRSGARE